MNIRFNNIVKSVALIAFASFVLAGCSTNPLSPGVEYMPDMYRSPAVEEYVDYGELWDRNRDSLRLAEPAMYPVKGTIPYSADPSKAQFNYPYPYANTVEGYEAASVGLTNPLKFTESVYLSAQANYATYCMHCHGEQGKGNGVLVVKEKFAAPPAYQGIAGLTPGKMFHTLMYGKGNMGSHAGQLNREQRWELVHYVQTLRDEQYENSFVNGVWSPVTEKVDQEVIIETVGE